MARLEVVAGVGIGATFPLEDEVSLGRGAGNTIPLADDLVSRHHARIWRQGLRFVIEDLDSTNGTRLRGQRLAPRTPWTLLDGDEIQLGDTLLLFHAEADDFVTRDTVETIVQHSLVHETAQPRLSPPANGGLVLPDNLPPSATIIALDASAAAASVDDTTTSSNQVLQETLKRLQAVYQISTTLGTITEWDELLQKILECLFRVFPVASGAAIILRERDVDDLVLVAIDDRHQDSGSQDKVVLPQTIVNQVVKHHRSILLTDSLYTDASDDEVPGDYVVRSVMCVPLLVENEVLGLLQVDARADRSVFSAEDLQTCAGVASQAAIAIKNVRTYEDFAVANRELQETITRRVRFEEQLRRDALHDALTGLPNRALFLDRLGRLIERVSRDSAYRFAVLFLDLDDFKRVNDSFGHAAGDRMLVELAQRLTVCLRRSDTVARMGGDEFAVLLDNITGEDVPFHAVERIQRALANPFMVDGQALCTTASIGIALSGMDYKRPEDLLRAADAAMYWAKAQGRGLHAIFSPSMHHQALERSNMEAELRRAISQKEFQVYYQPIVALDAGQLVGFEALVRWQHPERGLMTPAAFLAVAEETGLIIQIDRVVLQAACQQMQRWRHQFAAQPPALISVNMSGKQFRHADFFGQVSRILTETGLDPCYLKLEITESALIEHADAAAAVLAQLHKVGIRLSIDDFGTGYSSLSSLHRFRFDVLKIDPSFVNQIGLAEEHEKVIKAIVGLAQVLDMRVVAEGIETSEQLHFLQTLGCAYGQGFLFSEPLEDAAATALLAAGKMWGQRTSREQDESHNCGSE